MIVLVCLIGVRFMALVDLVAGSHACCVGGNSGSFVFVPISDRIGDLPLGLPWY